MEKQNKQGKMLIENYICPCCENNVVSLQNFNTIKETGVECLKCGYIGTADDFIINNNEDEVIELFIKHFIPQYSNLN